jgi:hexosaminidase
MRNHIRKSGLFAIVFLLFTISCTHEKSEAGNTISIIPEPVSIKYLNSSFVLSSKTVIIVDGEDERLISTGQLLSETLVDLYGIKIKLSDEDQDMNSIILISDKGADESLGEEGYELEISKEKITLKGQSVGLFYGMQTLLQLVPVESIGHKKIEIPGCEISDYPRFSWRGMHLDVSRHFFGPEMIRKYIDIMAMYKLNVFHWHLTDDQGWRIEIDKYPLLTEIGAWREGTGTEPWNYFINPATEGKSKYGGYYTKEEIREIIEYAADRYITIVPEIELPGHSWAALLAYPELSCSGVPWTKPDDVSFEFSDPFCAGNERTFEFFKNVLEEVIELFPSEYVHIGGDECKKSPWEDCDKCQQRMESEGLDNVEELQSYFIKRIEKVVLSKGRRIIGWNEILEGGLAPEATVMSWQGEKGGIEAAKHGHSVVMTPGSNLYFNRDQFISEKENNPKVLLIEDVYNYHPVPDVLNEEEAKLILGAQGCLWSEYLYSEKILEIQLLPRLTAMAEMVWTAEENKDWESYQLRLGNHLAIFDLLGVNYYIPSPSGLEDRLFIEEEYLVVIDEMSNMAYQSSVIRYTIDGTEPDKDSKIYSVPFYVPGETIVKAKTFMLSGGESATSTAKFTRVNLQVPTDAADFQSGLNLQVFAGDISSLDDFSQMKQSKQLTANEIKIPADVPDDHFGLIFSGIIDIPADGVYTFYSSSDDGSRLYLNGDLLVCNDGIHGMEIEYGQAALAAGKHTLKLEYFENNYGEGLKVEIEGPGLDRQEIPASFLYR